MTEVKKPEHTPRSADGREEFPGFVNVFEASGEAEPRDDDPEAARLNRRAFLALSAAVGAGMAGCRRPDIAILPFANLPDEQVGHIVHGLPTFYATSLPRVGGALPVLVESHDGRPTKIEGNPQHPCNRGSSDAHAQAAIYDLYSPDRVLSEQHPGVMQGNVRRTWSDFDRFARAEFERLAKTKGKGLAVLAEPLPSPALRLMREAIREKLPEMRWYSYDTTDAHAAIASSKTLFNGEFLPRYRFDKAERILALDSDFLGADADSIYYSRGLALKRKDEEQMNRLYVVESTYTITGTMADHRLRLPASQIGAFLIAVVRHLESAHGAKLMRNPIAFQVPEAADVSVEWAAAVANDLAAFAGRALVVAGARQPDWVRMLAHMINAALGNYEQGMAEFLPPPPELLDGTLAELVGNIREGNVETLLITGGNPVFNAPADFHFSDELAKVPKTIRLGLYHDQTSEQCGWHLPLAHDLESWGDTEAGDGSLCCVQPLIEPLGSEGASDDAAPPARGGRTLLEVLALITQAPGVDGKPVQRFREARPAAYHFIRRSFSARSGIALDDPNFDTAFNRYKQLGFFPIDPEQAKALGFAKADENARRPQLVEIAIEKPRIELKSPPARDALEVTFHPSYALGDGRFAMNPWLQELPDPITKLVWDNAAILSPTTAAAFGVAQGDLVEVRLGTRTLTIPAFVLPGQADWSVALMYGHFGQMRIAHVPGGGGTNVFPLRTSGAMHIADGAQLTRTGEAAELVATQVHGFIPEGRDIIREAFNSAPKASEQKPERVQLDLARQEKLDSSLQWGMVIDLSACTGCSACVIACQAENNIPVVGKDEVKRHREMHWIRIDRYFLGDANAPRIVSQPLACVQCEQAPCEQVCPVNASVHSPEGLNLQVYNRCIGTRYCSNACPYKVRRFNWFDFNKRRLDELRVPTPLADGSGVPETLKMQKNPDVSVRMRGVMEKCTYCIQRIERGKTSAKLAAAKAAWGEEGKAAVVYPRPANPQAAGYDLDAQGRVTVPDGVIVTACEAACPTQAITFGNTLDPASRVAKLKAKENEYLLLGELNTKPRTGYLPRIRNRNPELMGEG